MTQTIATVRGTGSGAGSGAATLFTQSDGNATRVIFNQFAAYSATSNRGSLSFTMNHVVSNGSTNTIGWFRSSGDPGSTSFQLCPNPNGTSPTQTAPYGSGGSTWINGGIIGAAGNYPGSSTGGGILVQVPLTSTNNWATSYAPQNFWIGPGDSVVIRWAYGGWYNPSSGDTVTPTNIVYAYHFTTITES